MLLNVSHASLFMANGGSKEYNKNFRFLKIVLLKYNLITCAVTL